MSPLTEAEEISLAKMWRRREAEYLAMDDPRRQSGFARDARDWERFRRPVAEAIDRGGSFLDVGCANGLLMEGVVAWTRERGHRVEPYGLEISDKLADLARRRLPHWRDRISVGDARVWEAPVRFDFVRTEMVYAPPSRRREYVERLLDRFVAPGGRLIVCSYGSSRPEGARAEELVGELDAWGFAVDRIDDARSPEHGFVITRAVSVRRRDE